MRKFNSFNDSGDKHVDTDNNNLLTSWDTSSKNEAVPYALRPMDSGTTPSTINSKIFQSNKIMIRLRGNTNLHIKDIEVPFYGRLKNTVSPASGTFIINNLFGFTPGTDTSTISGILNDYNIIGLGIDESISTNNTTVTHTTGGDYEINLSGGKTVTGSLGDYVGFTKLSGDFSSQSDGENGQPSGMGYNYHKSFGCSTSGESKSFADWADRGSGSSASQPSDTTLITPLKMINTNLDALKVEGGVIGFEISESTTSVHPNRTEPVRLITFYGQKEGVDLGHGVSTKVVLAEKELPELYFDSDKKLNLISSLDSVSLLDGPWCPIVFDSTVANNTERDITLEIIKPI